MRLNCFIQKLEKHYAIDISPKNTEDREDFINAAKDIKAEFGNKVYPSSNYVSISLFSDSPGLDKILKALGEKLGFEILPTTVKILIECMEEGDDNGKKIETLTKVIGK